MNPSLLISPTSSDAASASLGRSPSSVGRNFFFRNLKPTTSSKPTSASFLPKRNFTGAPSVMPIVNGSTYIGTPIRGGAGLACLGVFEFAMVLDAFHIDRAALSALLSRPSLPDAPSSLVPPVDAAAPGMASPTQALEACTFQARAIIEAHQAKGHRVAIISSATIYQIEPTARDLGITDIKCSAYEIEDGVFTGEIIRPLCFGEGKVLAAEELAAEYGLDLDQSFFYSDSDDDIELLERVGKPRPLNPNMKLKGIADERNWPVQRFVLHTKQPPAWRRALRCTIALHRANPGRSNCCRWDRSRYPAGVW